MLESDPCDLNYDRKSGLNFVLQVWVPALRDVHHRSRKGDSGIFRTTASIRLSAAGMEDGMKIRTLMTAASLIFATLAPLATASASSGPVGEWQIADRSANIAIRPCGANLCGFVSWSKDTAAAVGRQVLINMKPSGHLWSGTVVNVVDGEKYDARISLLTDSILKVEGCVMGGMICGGQEWSRVR